MGQTKIEWTEQTWNPVTGCTKFSSGCQHCYAEAFSRRLKAMGNPRYLNGFNVTVHYDLIELPLSWEKPRRIFVNSMSDLFHDDVPDDVILKIFKTMNKAHHHKFQVLTKRSKRLFNLSNKIIWTKNIWMGVSIEDDNCLYRSDDLRSTGAHVKFVSAEPLLESLNGLSLKGIDWLIVGGESGAGSRTMQKIWVDELLNKAREANTAFFFKQWGGYNKKKNGKLLDGVLIQEYPNK